MPQTTYIRRVAARAYTWLGVAYEQVCSRLRERRRTTKSSTAKQVP